MLDLWSGHVFKHSIKSNDPFTYQVSNGKEYQVEVKKEGQGEFLTGFACPWEDRGVDLMASLVITLTDSKTGRQLQLSGWHQHFIADHGFFGAGNFRLPPEDVVAWSRKSFGID